MCRGRVELVDYFVRGEACTEGNSGGKFFGGFLGDRFGCFVGTKNGFGHRITAIDNYRSRGGACNKQTWAVCDGGATEEFIELLAVRLEILSVSSPVRVEFGSLVVGVHEVQGDLMAFGMIRAQDFGLRGAVDDGTDLPTQVVSVVH